MPNMNKYFYLVGLYASLLLLASSAQSEDYFSERNHLFPTQMMFELSIPLGGAKTKSVELSLNFNNFDNLSTRNVLVRFEGNGNIEIPGFNNFGAGAADWAKANPWLATGLVAFAIYGVSEVVSEDDDEEEGFACLDIFPAPPGCLPSGS